VELPKAKQETTVASGIGQLSLKLDVTPVGTAYHFRKLHGEPRLVLGARHESLDRGLTAVIWAGLCLTLAITVIRGLRRPDALKRAHRHWPWLAAIAGTAWLFLLPAGVLGLVLLVTALCLLITRLPHGR
jgi:drug/metabolite transporter (DMT)-like permease